MQSWREIFGSVDTHSAISFLVRENIYSYISIIFETGAINNDELIQFDTKSKEKNISDLSEVKDLLFYKFQAKSPVPTGIIKLLKSKAHKNRFYEFEIVVRQLVVYRNHWSHQVNHEETGWGIMFSGILLRLLELNISEKVSEKNIEIIRSAAQKLLTKSIFDDPYEYQKPLPDFRDKSESSEPIWVNEIKDNIQDLAAQIALQKDSLVRFTGNENLPSGENDFNIPVELDLITFEVASQKLLKMRKKIQYENEEKIDWPGADANILNSHVVSDISKLKPIDKEAFEYMPSIQKVNRENKILFQTQMSRWWEKIEKVLLEIDWKHERSK